MVTRTKELLATNPTFRDFLAKVIWGYTDGAPVDGAQGTGAGEAGTGALLVDITNGKVYKNTGTLASPTWNSLGDVDAAEITLAEGSILVGDAAGSAAALAAETDAQILIGDGTTVVSVPVSGDVTIDNAGAVTIGAGAVEEAMIEAASLSGVVAKVAAADNVIGALPVVHRITIPSGANGDVDVALTHKTRVIDAWAVLAGAGTAGSTITVKNAGDAISEVIDVSAGADTDVFRVAKIDDAFHEIAAAGTLRVSKASTGADFPGAEVYVLGLRVA